MLAQDLLKTKSGGTSVRNQIDFDAVGVIVSHPRRFYFFFSFSVLSLAHTHTHTLSNQTLREISYC